MFHICYFKSSKRREERSNAKAIGLSELVTEYRFVCTMLLLCGCFQVYDCDYSIFPKMVTRSIYCAA